MSKLLFVVSVYSLPLSRKNAYPKLWSISIVAIVLLVHHNNQWLKGFQFLAIIILLQFTYLSHSLNTNIEVTLLSHNLRLLQPLLWCGRKLWDALEIDRFLFLSTTVLSIYTRVSFISCFLLLCLSWESKSWVSF